MHSICAGWPQVNTDIADKSGQSVACKAWWALTDKDKRMANLRELARQNKGFIYQGLAQSCTVMSKKWVPGCEKIAPGWY